jgi:hypothetical protein
MYDHIISLGSDCECGENLEKFYGKEEKSLFSRMGWGGNISNFIKVFKNPELFTLKETFNFVNHFNNDQKILDHCIEKHKKLLDLKNVVYLIKLGNRSAHWRHTFPEEFFTNENLEEISSIILPYGDLIFITTNTLLSFNKERVFLRFVKKFPIYEGNGHKWNIDRDFESWNKIFEEFPWTGKLLKDS